MTTGGQAVNWIQAMARVEDGFVIILDIDKTLEQDAILNVAAGVLPQDCIETRVKGN